MNCFRSAELVKTAFLSKALFVDSKCYYSMKKRKKNLICNGDMIILLCCFLAVFGWLTVWLYFSHVKTFRPNISIFIYLNNILFSPPGKETPILHTPCLKGS